MTEWCLCFFFKQKTANEIEYGLVGSEMCIRDRAQIAKEKMKARPEAGYKRMGRKKEE